MDDELDDLVVVECSGCGLETWAGRGEVRPTCFRCQGLRPCGHVVSGEACESECFAFD